MPSDRDRLVELLRPAEPWPGAPSPETIADRIWPVVDRIANERAAAELRDIAGTAVRVLGSVLRGRAHTLDGKW